jgi:hypothetical protein
MRNFQPKPYFQAVTGAEKPPEVKFDFNNTKAPSVPAPTPTPAPAPAK